MIDATLLYTLFANNSIIYGWVPGGWLIIFFRRLFRSIAVRVAGSARNYNDIFDNSRNWVIILYQATNYHWTQAAGWKSIRLQSSHIHDIVYFHLRNGGLSKKSKLQSNISSDPLQVWLLLISIFKYVYTV